MIPQNEAGVLVLFAQQAHAHGLTIIKAQQGFPDLTVEDRHGNTFRIELEYAASNFVRHRHDPRECDAVVCWVLDEELPLPTISLQEQWEMVKPEQLLDGRGREIAYWKLRAQAAERQVAYSGGAPLDRVTSMPLTPEGLGRVIIKAALEQVAWVAGGRVPSRDAMMAETDWLTQQLWNSARALLKMMGIHAGHNRWRVVPGEAAPLLHSAYARGDRLFFVGVDGETLCARLLGQAVGGRHIYLDRKPV